MDNKKINPIIVIIVIIVFLFIVSKGNFGFLGATVGLCET